MSARYAVAGNPVAHSQSPFIHAAYAEQTAQVLSYDRLLCPLDAFAETLRGFAAAGGRGCNVTVPFKFEAFALAARHSDRARLAGAVNTLRFDEAGWLGDNTDGAGLVRDIERNAGLKLEGKRVLLLGAGGASAGVMGSLIQARPAEVVLANRTRAKAQAIVDAHRAWAAEHGVRIAAAGLDDCGAGFEVLVNGTSASLNAGGIPVGPEVLAPGALALDMMYGPAAAPFLAWATSHGATARDGLGMLVEQAAEAFELWRGVQPATGPVLAALRQKVSA